MVTSFDSVRWKTSIFWNLGKNFSIFSAFVTITHYFFPLLLFTFSSTFLLFLLLLLLLSILLR